MKKWALYPVKYKTKKWRKPLFFCSKEIMRFYTVKNEYIAHLRGVDKNVPENYGGKRPYVGVVIEINGCKYLAPLTSYKPKQDGFKNSPAIMKLHERGNPANKLGMIQLSNMIPVTDDVVVELDLTKEDPKYQRMLQKQLEFIKTQRDEIVDKTTKLYKLVCTDKNPFYVKLSCDFANLETALQEYVRPSDRN
ncbi:hypothetical protein hmeg3_19400 [Herbaspirillum sp. meg3]|uniref:type III toxin-antitoxin system ToxN/AbiQ family toxin n=1 Tax=Herbaspirillum sp. meg3 TaxID=2025949 RepID=UPI000B98344D|nr:type III toxin-antitoxin system ToxN/AbiQ family toxin [Herbaspirillum sp. meg3]ASU40241.1 hypothetical protein hmeg3_19400 [Herbaspirillum sp. meg3]